MTDFAPERFMSSRDIQYKLWLSKWEGRKAKLEEEMKDKGFEIGHPFAHWDYLTSREQQVTWFIWEFKKKTRESPTYQQIADSMGISKAQVQYLVKELEVKEVFEKMKEPGSNKVHFVAHGSRRRQAEIWRKEQEADIAKGKTLNPKEDIQEDMAAVFGNVVELDHAIQQTTDQSREDTEEERSEETRFNDEEA